MLMATFPSPAKHGKPEIAQASASAPFMVLQRGWWPPADQFLAPGQGSSPPEAGQ